MNKRWSRTLAMLATLSVAGPSGAWGAELGPQLSAATNATGTSPIAAIDKAAEAQRLAAMAAQLAQRAAQLAAESQGQAPVAVAAPIPPASSAEKAGWNTANASEATTTEAAPAAGWRTHRKAEDIAIRFKGQETAPQRIDARPIQSAQDDEPQRLAAPITMAAPAPPANRLPAITPVEPAPAAAVASPATTALPPAANDLAAATAGNLGESPLLSDANVQQAARSFQEEELIPEAEAVPPVQGYSAKRKNQKITEDDVNGTPAMGPDGEYYGDPCCPPQRMMFWTGGVEATFLNPDLNNSIAEFGFADFTTDTVRYSDTDDIDVDSFYLAPRVWLGVQGCKWGANLRYFHLNAQEAGYDPVLGSNGEWDGPDCGIPDFGYSSSNQLEAYTIDFEITRRVCLHDCAMLFSMGVRHASLSQDEMIAGAGLSEDSTVMGFASAHRESRGTGLVFGWYGRRPIFPCSCVHWFYNARFSSVWGPTQTASETGVMLAISDPDAGVIGNAGSVNNASTYVDDTMFIGEIQLGLEWMYGLRCLPANAFFRCALEYQRWDGGRGFTAAGSFAGAEIDDELTTFTESFASATEPQLDLIGLTIGTGLTW